MAPSEPPQLDIEARLPTSSSSDDDAPLGAPLLHDPRGGGGSGSGRRVTLSGAAICAMALLLVSLAAAMVYFNGGVDGGAAAGVRNDDFPWTNEMQNWQRSGFHFQPKKNFQADPNAALYYKGWYHFFYQYNPTGTAWDYTISWGHAVSKDLIHWNYLPIAMRPDHWYDEKGVWSGYSTMLPNGTLIVLYTGGTKELVQVQNLAVPANISDPLLLSWNKSTSNPILVPPKGIEVHDFRDPFPIWYNRSDSRWHMVIGSKDPDHYGTVLVYTTKDFINYTLLPDLLHTTRYATGMLECVDLFPVAMEESQAHLAIDMTETIPGPGMKYVLKASMDDERHDYYALGSFDLDKFKFTPDDSTIDVGVGLRYDWGKFYASKTFYDSQKQRRVLWGYVGEVDSKMDDLHKGWANLQNIPRTILFDTKTKSNLLLWPIEEVESLRMDEHSFSSIPLYPGSTYQLEVGEANQLDIVAEFEVDPNAIEATIEADVSYNCSTSGGAAHRGLVGPFGLLVLADQGLTEQTATYFYVSRGIDGNLRTHFCQDELRSSKAGHITKRVVGNTVPVLNGETWALRLLVDHSIVESFAQKGRAVATSRVYPTVAYSNARLFLFNNATDAVVNAKTVNVWHMNTTHHELYPGIVPPP